MSTNPGKHPEQVEDPADGDRPGKPGAPFAAMLSPGAPGATASRSTYSAKKNAQTIWNAEVEHDGPGLTPGRDRVGKHDADSASNHHVVHAAQHPGGGVGCLGLQQLIEPFALHPLF